MEIQIHCESEETLANTKMTKVGISRSGLRINDAKSRIHLKPKEKTSLAKEAGKVGLRKSLVPGTIVIILTGKHQGSRGVFLKQMESGLILVSGVKSINQVPLYRMDQQYVIATSTRIDVSSISLDECTDKVFAVPKKIKKDKFVSDENTMDVENSNTDKIAALQERIGGQIETIVSGDALMKEYLGSMFELKRGQAPHKMRF